jgi:hemolysin
LIHEKVTGNIENLTIESKQNTSTTKGSTKGRSDLKVAMENYQ